MAAEQDGFVKGFWTNVGYGLAAGILLVLPGVIIYWVFQQLPFLGQLFAWIQSIDAPGIAGVLTIVAILFALALTGFIVRRFLWDWISGLPVIGTLVTSSQQFAKVVGSMDRSRRDVVVWVTFRFYRHLGVVSGRTVDPDGTEWVNVYVLSGTGQFQGNSICNIQADRVVYPGWTIDDAIVFSSSGGAVVPQDPQPPYPTGREASRQS